MTLDGHRHGSTYKGEYDFARLNKQARRVAEAMLAEPLGWWALSVLEKVTGDPQASISARLRDFRKERFGGRTVHRRRHKGGLFVYKLEPEEWLPQPVQKELF